MCVCVCVCVCMFCRSFKNWKKWNHTVYSTNVKISTDFISRWLTSKHESGVCVPWV